MFCSRLLLLFAVVIFACPLAATRFHRLVRDNKIAEVTAALRKKNLVNELDSEGRPPLYYAIVKGHEGMVRLLLEQGAQVQWTDKAGNSLLHVAARHGMNAAGPMIVGILLDEGALPFSRNKMGKTPADLAREAGHVTLSAFLAGLMVGKVCMSVEHMGENNFEMFAAASFGDLGHVIKSIEAGADPTCVFDGLSGAEVALASGSLAVARHLCGLGAPGVDEALLDATEAFNEALQLRQDARAEQQPFAFQGREELEPLKRCVQRVLESQHLNPKNSKWLFKAFGRLLQLRTTTPICMLCHRPGKIAGSHYVSDAILSFLSSHWVVPGSSKTFGASSMTLPLFCTNSKKNDRKCEQLLSQEGEDTFGKIFLPFMKEVADGRMVNPNSEHTIEYGPWLFHCAASLAFRVFLSDLENDENWLSKLENDPLLIAGGEAAFNFVENMRQFLLGLAAPTFNIRLYLSENGMAGQNELPLITNIGLSFENTWKVRVLISIRGFHFVVTSNDGKDEQLMKMMKLPKNGFVSAIDPKGGIIKIGSHHRAVLPECIKKDVEANTRHQMNELGNLNHEVISQAVTKMKIPVTGLPCQIDKIFALPRFKIMLPDYLRFKAAGDGAGFRPGRLESANAEVVLKHYAEFVDEEIACWIFEYAKAGLNFCVIHFGGDPTDTVMAWQFDPGSLTSEVWMRAALTSDFSQMMKAMSVLRGTDHSGVQLADPTAPATTLALTMMAKQKLPAFIQDYEFSFEDETLAHRESIKDIQHLMQQDGEIVPCRLVACEPDGNCGFSSLRITRGDFISRVVKAYRENSDALLMSMVEGAMADLGVATIDEWAKVFDDNGHWMTFVHLRIASRLYGLRIRVYIVPAQNMIPDGVRGDVFVPLAELAQHVIDETDVLDPQEANLAWTTMRPLEAHGHAVLNHFDRIELGEQIAGPPQVFDLSVLSNAINAAMLYALFLQKQSWR